LILLKRTSATRTKAAQNSGYRISCMLEIALDERTQ
jgi:hypothetical protein